MKKMLYLFLVAHSLVAFSQESNDINTAQKYYNNREYDKAVVIYKSFFAQNPAKYYTIYRNTLIHLKSYNEALEVAKSMEDKSAAELSYKIDQYHIYKLMGDENLSQKIWKKCLDQGATSTSRYIEMIHLLEEYKDYPALIDLTLKARERFKLPNFQEEYLMVLYLKSKEYSKATEEFVRSVHSKNSDYFHAIQYVQPYLQNKDFAKLVEKEIYTQLSKNPNEDKWNEIAIWLSMHLKEFDEAMTFAIALDKRKNNDGNKVWPIISLALNEKNYPTAIRGFDYLISKNQNPSTVKKAMESKLDALTLLLSQSNSIDSISYSDQLSSLYSTYWGLNHIHESTGATALLYADYLMKYRHSTDSAIGVLKQLLASKPLSKEWVSMAKLRLGDYYLISGEIWEASLLYEQVDKEEKDSPLGEEARFKNSRLFYYQGEFELAEDLLSILKSSTSELIANDALYLAVFIQENMDGDTLEEALKDVARSELLFNQNKDQEALFLLQKITSNPKSSKLIDDIVWIKAQYYLNKKKWTLAEDELKKFQTEYKSSILSDKALYSLGMLYEETLVNPAKAKDIYLDILTNYKDSVYTADARKRLRKLRGENLEEDPM